MARQKKNDDVDISASLNYDIFRKKLSCDIAVDSVNNAKRHAEDLEDDFLNTPTY